MNYKSTSMSKRSEKFNKIQADQRRFYEADNILLMNLIISKGWMSMNSLAKYLNIDVSAISRKLSRYEKENS